jgi:CheY-like chemotaxis protein
MMSTNTYKILIADDNPVNLDLATRLLRKKGHEITSAENGKEAVELFLQDSFDVILMDLEMPVIGGRIWRCPLSAGSKPPGK